MTAMTDTGEPARTAGARGALLALAIGAFGIGTTEFSPMGLLPVIAVGVGVSIPTAGLLISAYAVSVMVGAPIMTLNRFSGRADAHHAGAAFPAVQPYWRGDRPAADMAWPAAECAGLKHLEGHSCIDYGFESGHAARMPFRANVIMARCGS